METRTIPITLQISYALAVLAVFTVLHFHLLPAVFAGLAVYALTAKLALKLPVRWGTLTQKVALAGIILFVIGLVSAICLGLWSFLRGHHGMSNLLGTAAETLDNLKRNLPEEMTALLPDTVDELREQVVTMLREHGKNISSVGISGVKTFAHLVLGMVVGSLAVLHRFNRDAGFPPLASHLHDRLLNLASAFDKVVFAQVKISLLNTALTALYLAVILPLCGVYLPMVTLLILLTFIAGLLPVVGNLISNFTIVLISLGASPMVGVASLAFLVLIHKLEYFTNARIVGSEVKASVWELLTAMLVMEAIFGVAGLVAAPVVYAWLKAELKAYRLV
ncbi:AI-2E family transporter [Geomonas paludis]|uniref:AI-2E family transporter n=1 Tax=Geomonas paludis TaxID=2740185 RepID=A0A6V8MQ53_9BACT|nr:AI-2E family transporter [Geomonas paludis]UPU36203.1 AI-2E family transporter [Geomonas paludis]GFO62185.1 membrane protein [Geomonas paludis]